ncbi:MAG TPA: zinc ribbon domain-containing protein [Pyrinomonadaceae bacterium]|nr:zinc ribbon domain-containing protein [Pyrinomonadaceae bacterium]
MFCPRCGSSQDEELKFCKSCGANLYAVRLAVDSRQTDEKINWNKTWVAEMFASSAEAVKRQKELERLQGITPEIKRYNEIKAGVITSSVGVALMIFLAIFMQGIILGGKVPNDTAEILSRIWVAGVIPVFIGLALIFNGYFVSKKMIEAAKREGRETGELPGATLDTPSLKPANTTEFAPTRLSVTEDTTRHLK